ncbi:hypothetical protein ASA1KI_35790 [Opitutales bacterium ASA1]|uniref:hypothetical protein n=1 Tax=Congregicoccus parvus TaxID=3081749 RepID=UPI002B2818FC|nr:hypothetical protein ASA1KI_35790 [Opitutales bacterium ASA1]
MKRSLIRLLSTGVLAAVAIASEGASAAVELPDLAPKRLLPSAKLEGPPHTREVSGIVASKQWPGVFWLHNDSGDETRIYPMRRDGSMITSARGDDRPGVLVGGVINSDWEAIAADASGHIIIGDVGNNSNGRRDLALHYVVEPEPTAGFTGLLKSVFVRYPEQKEWPAPKHDFNYDCEGIFTVGDTVYFVTKRRSDSLARLYRLDHPKTGVVNTLEIVADFDVRGRATAADATLDGRRLVVLTYTAIWMFESTAPGRDDWFDGSVWWLPFEGAPGAEGVCFDGTDTILVAAEEGNGHLYAVNTASLHKVR